MKLNQVSIPTRTVNPNLKNSKTAAKNPSFGATLYMEETAKNEINRHGEIFQAEYYKELLPFVENLKKYI